MKGLDYAFRRPLDWLNQVKLSGFEFVCRYYDHGSGKTLVAEEASDIHSAGLSIFTVFEGCGGAPGIDGCQPGDSYFTTLQASVDAHAALQAAKSAGQPQGLLTDGRPSWASTVCFAVDYDCQDPNLLTEYFRVVAQVLQPHGYWVGVYGNYRVTRFAGSYWQFVPNRWQTYAWSGGLVDGGAELYQYSNGETVHEASVDFNESSAQGWSTDMTPDEVKKLVLQSLTEFGLDANTFKFIKDRLAADAHHKHSTTTTGEPIA